MSYIKKHRLEWSSPSNGGGSGNNGGGDGASAPSGGTNYGGSWWSGGDSTDPTSPNFIGPQAPTNDASVPGSFVGPPAPGPDTSSSTYQSDFLSNMYNNPDTDWGSYNVALKPLDAQTVQSWGNVKEAQTALNSLPSSEGVFGNMFNQQYNADGSEAGWSTSPFGQKINYVGRTLMGMNPYGRLANMGIDAYNGVNPLRIAANAIPGTNGTLARMGADVAGGESVGSTLGKNIGGALGGFGAGNFTNSLLGGSVPGALASIFAGRQGAEVGAQVGANVGNQMGNMVKTAYNPSQQTGTGMENTQSFWGKLGGLFGDSTPQQQVAQAPTQQQPSQLTPANPFGAVIGGLGSLYLGNQAISSMRDQQQALQQQQQSMQQQQGTMPSLAEMYGPNSSYANEMRRALAAKDAKAGRNSQYGAREAQLQALLAEKGSQYAAQQAQMNNSNQTSQLAFNKAANDNTLQQNQIRAQQLGSLYNLGEKTGLNSAIGSGLRGLYDQAAPALYNMFGGGSQPSTPSYGYEEA